MSNRLPTPHLLDPWWDLVVPALFGDRHPVSVALTAALAVSPDDGNLHAVAARAWAALGNGPEANRCAERAFSLGGGEADALAVFARRG